MPRSSIKAERHMYAATDLSRAIYGHMHGVVTQAEIGRALAGARKDKLPISQQAVSCKIRDSDFSYMELVFLFDILGFSDDEILRCMKGVGSI